MTVSEPDQSRVRVISELDPGDASFDVTDARVMAQLRDAEERHFWHRARNEWIVERLAALGVRAGARIIELGCGAGCVTAHLSRCGYDVVGVDGQRSQLALASQRAPQARFWLHDLRLGTRAIPERSFDVCGLFDVVEHLDQPTHALHDASELVRAGGLIVGTVPALRWLWSRVDEQAGHRTRFERAELRKMLEQVPDTAPVEVVSFGHALVPLMWLQRKLIVRKADKQAISMANLRVPPRGLNALLMTMLRGERRMQRWCEALALPGASLWFALRRTSDTLAVPRGGIEPPT